MCGPNNIDNTKNVFECLIDEVSISESKICRNENEFSCCWCVLGYMLMFWVFL